MMEESEEMTGEFFSINTRCKLTPVRQVILLKEVIPSQVLPSAVCPVLTLCTAPNIGSKLTSHHQRAVNELQFSAAPASISPAAGAAPAPGHRCCSRSPSVFGAVNMTGRPRIPGSVRNGVPHCQVSVCYQQLQLVHHHIECKGGEGHRLLQPAAASGPV